MGPVTTVKEPTLVTLDYGSGSYEIRIVGIDAPRASEAFEAEALTRPGRPGEVSWASAPSK